MAMLQCRRTTIGTNTNLSGESKQIGHVGKSRDNGLVFIFCEHILIRKVAVSKDER